MRRAGLDYQQLQVSHPLANLFAQGQVGVQLFFAISGFILSLPFATQYIQNGKTVRLRSYYLRRLVRLEPPYLIALTIVTILLIGWRGESWSTVIPHYAASLVYCHYFVYGYASTIIPAAWSLEVEVQFYILAPLIARVLFRRRRWSRRLALMVTIFCFSALQSNFNYPCDAPLHGWTLLHSVHWFLVGFLLADLYVCGTLQANQSVLWWDAAAAIGLALTGWFMQEQIAVHYLVPWTIMLFFVGVFKGHLFRRLLSLPIVYIVGGMCYTTYLYHGVCKGWLGDLILPSFQALPFDLRVIAISSILVPFIIVASTALFVVFERPFMSRELFQSIRGRLKGVVSVVNRTMRERSHRV